MTRFFLYAVPLAAVLAIPSLGCSGSIGPEPTATATAAPDTAGATRAPLATPLHGPLKIMSDALADVPLSAAQRPVVEKLAADTAARHAASQAAHRDLQLALADQIQAGAIDRTALKPKIDALGAALEAAQPADRAAFEQLHGLLTADQRTAFVNALQAHVGDRISAVQDKHPLQQWATDLQLTDDQKTQIHANLKQSWQAAQHDGLGAPWAEHRQHAKQMMTAFAQDRFVMDEVAPAKDLTSQARRMTERLLGLAEAALPVLTAEQRVLAAQKLRTKANSLDVEAPVME